MSKLSNQNEKNNITRVYFLTQCYAKGGGTYLFVRLAEYLLQYTKIKVGIIDYRDGITARTMRRFFPQVDISYIDYESLDWDLEDNSCIFTPVERLGTIKNISNHNIRILEYHWNTDTGYSLIFEKSILKKLASLLYKTDSASFMNYACYLAACQTLHKKFKKNYIPVFYPNENEDIIINSYQEKNEINLVWLGRLAPGSKTYSLVNIINNFYQYKTDKRKKFHIIGNGLTESYIKDYSKKYRKNIQFIFTGVLSGDSLNKYLLENTDVGVAMGTSMLNFAALRLPVIGVHEPRRANFQSRNFLWLFNMCEYCLGAPVEAGGAKDKRFEKIEVFDDMLDKVMSGNNRQIYGNKCYEYHKSTHADIEFIGGKFLEAIQQTTLTFEKLKECFKFIPYGGDKGVAVHTYKIGGIPIFKTIHHLNKVRYYFCGIEIARRQLIRGRNKWHIFGIEISQKWWGRYNFPHLVSPEVKKQCKDLYAIDKCLFEKGGSQ